MAEVRKNLKIGVGLIPNSTSQNAVKGDIETLTSDNKLHFFGASNDALVSETVAATLTNKSLDDTTTAIVDTSDPTIKVKIDAAGTTNTVTTILSSQTANRILTLPDATDTLVGKATTDTLTNKTISGASNTITNIADGSLSANVMLLNAIQQVTATKQFTSGKLSLSGSGSGNTVLNASATASGTLTLPAATDTLVGKATIDVLTNKTLTSPVINTATADTITGIAAGPLTLTSPSGQNLLLQNNATTIGTVTSTGLTLASAKQLVLTNNSQTVSLQASATASATYTITVPDAAPTTGTALVFNGTNYVWSTVSGGFTVTNSTSLAAGGTVSISTTTALQAFRVASSGGAVTLSSTPFGTSAPTTGTIIRLIGTSDVNTVSISNNTGAKGCVVKGTPVLHLGDVIEFMYNSTDDFYVECNRNF